MSESFHERRLSGRTHPVTAMGVDAAGNAGAAGPFRSRCRSASDDGVDMRARRHLRIHQVPKAYRPLVIELDQDHRAVNAVIENTVRVVSPIHAKHVRSRCARTSSIFTRACPSSMLST